ncbi:hypothetical protein VM98_33815, partial [Streptomyces rubellomurinus subsp. indigoferus]
MLGRLRRAVGDPLLVRAGQGLVPTPRAPELREEVGALLRACDGLLRPGAGFEPGRLHRTFAVQASALVLAGTAGPPAVITRPCLRRLTGTRPLCTPPVPAGRTDRRVLIRTGPTASEHAEVRVAPAH